MLVHDPFACLTSVERALVTALSDGQSLADFAANRGTSLNTVRSQLKSVFQKLGVSRQGELVALVHKARSTGQVPPSLMNRRSTDPKG